MELQFVDLNLAQGEAWSEILRNINGLMIGTCYAGRHSKGCLIPERASPS